jgi:hypothetical protein
VQEYYRRLLHRLARSLCIQVTVASGPNSAARGSSEQPRHQEPLTRAAQSSFRLGTTEPLDSFDQSPTTVINQSRLLFVVDFETPTIGEKHYQPALLVASKPVESVIVRFDVRAA